MQMRIFILFISTIGILYGQNKSIRVQGNAPLLTNTTIALGQYSDYITQTETILSTQNIGSDGKFLITLDNVLTGEYILHIGTVNHSLILEPGHTYNLEIPDQVGEELYYPTETDTTLLLYQVSNLDYQINYFSVYNYEDFANGRIKNKLKKFIDSMDVQYSFIKDKYFIEYKEYKMAVLMSNARYKSRRTLFQTFFKSKPILYNHPQYMAYFNEMYTGMMNELIKLGNNTAITNAITNGTSIDSILVTIKKQELGDDSDLAELICIKGLFELYYLPGFDKYKIEQLVIELKENTKRITIGV